MPVGPLGREAETGAERQQAGACGPVPVGVGGPAGLGDDRGRAGFRGVERRQELGTREVSSDNGGLLLILWVIIAKLPILPVRPSAAY